MTTTLETTSADAIPSDGSYRSVCESITAINTKIEAIVKRSLSQGDLTEIDSKEASDLKEKQGRLITLRDLTVEGLRSRLAAQEQGKAMESSLKSSSDNRGAASQFKSRRSRKEFILRDASYADAFGDYLYNGERMNSEEFRTMSVGVDSAGGYLPSQDFYSMLEKVLLQQTIMQQICRTIPLGTFKTYVAVESALAVADWRGEGQPITESTPGPTFNQVLFQPNTLTSLVKSSIELIEDAPSRGPDFSIETIVADQMGRVMGQKREEAFTVGTGIGQPKGLFAYTAGGEIPIGKTCASATAFTPSELIDLLYALPRQYRESPDCNILTNDAGFAALRKMATPTSGTGTAGVTAVPFLWEPSYKLGEPDRLLGIPIRPTKYSPAFTTGLYPMIIGDTKRYCIGERTGMSIRVLRELYAANGQVGYLGWTRLDGKLLLPDAFRTLKMG
jgi:HK97 family phage major capsid protein